jgi:hypothetical protein
LVAVVAIEQPEQPILAADADHFAALSLDGGLEQRADLTEVGVMHVMRDELPVPEKLTRLGIECDERVRIEVGAGPEFPIEVWRGIADRQVQDTGFCIERQRRPQATAAMLQRLRVLPRFGAGLARIGNEIEFPNRFSSLEFECADPVLRTEICTRRTDDNEVAKDHRRHREILPPGKACDRLAPNQ